MKKVYKDRRQKLMGLIGDAVVIVPTNPHHTRSHDTEFSFRADSNFAHLVGHKEPEALLVLCPNNDKFKEVLFVRPKNPELELWMGERIGPQKAKDLYEVDEAYGIDELDDKLPLLIDGHSEVLLDLFTHSEWVQKLFPMIQKLSKQRKKKTKTPLGFRSLSPILGRMRLKKDEHEIELMKKAAKITHQAHCAAMAKAAPSVNEGQVQAILEYMFKDGGAQGPAYESIVAGANRANTLHYIQNDQELKSGDLLLIDAGCEYDLYACDVTRTFPVSGKYTDIQKKVYQLVLNSQKACIELAKPGNTLAMLHEKACEILSKGLVDLGFFKGKSADQVIDEGLYKTYFPHGTGHWLGMDVHDTCPYFDDDFQDLKFESGMVFTIEPGLYFNQNNQDVPDELKGIGIRIEDDILITKDGHINLTQSIPKEIDDVEQACQRDFRELL